jgi:hypothetical protein
MNNAGMRFLHFWWLAITRLISNAFELVQGVTSLLRQFKQGPLANEETDDMFSFEYVSVASHPH